ncbi:MAG TPA: hypothetical protein VH277_09860 [Gemmatimonadaceae bacterium]|nr:hypothetical protein [Gemmatimonadaceae bacterium]
MPDNRPSLPLRSFAISVTCAVGLVGTLSCHSTAPSYIVVDAARAAPAATRPVVDAGAGDTVVNAHFHNVHFHMWPGVALDLEDLIGRMRSTRLDRVVSFDDKTSFVLAIDSGTVGLDANDLARLMNTYVFAYRGAPLRDLSFAVEGPHLVQRGILHKVVDIPFEMVAEVNATPQGEIRVHPVSMKICSIPGQGLMEALGITLEKLLDVHEAKGVRVAGNDMFLDPTRLLPPPAIAGHLTSVRVAPGKLVQFFGSAPGSVARIMTVEPDTAAPNYMMFRGGTLQFGKLFMVHAEMQVIDLAPSDAFDFDIGRYHEQLVAGFHRTLPNDGLLVFMPDLRTLPEQALSKR